MNTFKYIKTVITPLNIFKHFILQKIRENSLSQFTERIYNKQEF